MIKATATLPWTIRLHGVLLAAATCLFVSGLALAQTADKCPTINGTFERVYKREGDREFLTSTTILTKIERGIFRYSLDPKATVFIPADGKEYPVADGEREAVARYTCEGGTLLREVRWKNSSVVRWTRYELVNQDVLNISDKRPENSGTYKRVR
jgi:hypothetical protein